MNGYAPPETYDDAGHAQYLARTTNGRFKFCPAYGWMYWNGRHYDADGAAQALDRAIVDMLRQRMNSCNVTDMAKCIPSSARVTAVRNLFDELVFVSVESFDANPFTLNCMNGEIDLRTGEMKPHDPTMLYTYCVNAEYDPHVDTSAWEGWLESVVDGGKDMVRYLQVLCGYTFTGLTREELFVYLWGATRSGKGTFTETLLALSGRPLGVGAKMSTFTDKRSGSDQNFDLAPLKAARLVVASESESTDWLNAAKIKNMTGGDYITCAFKHKDQFSYRPVYTIWLISNHPIQTDAEDDATWGRARVISFPHSHLGKEDKTLKERMKKPDNLKAVLNWIVWGAVEYFTNGLTTPKGVQENTQQARNDVDFVGKWLADNVTLGNISDYTTVTNLYQNYKSWCEDMGVSPKKQRGLSNSMQSKGIAASETLRVGPNVYRVIYGVKIGNA